MSIFVHKHVLQIHPPSPPRVPPALVEIRHIDDGGGGSAGEALLLFDVVLPPPPPLTRRPPPTAASGNPAWLKGNR